MTPSTPPQAVRQALQRLVVGQDLSVDQAYDAAAEIMRGESSDAQIGGLLTALRVKGETVDEIRGFVTAMRHRAIRLVAPSETVDPCGTGGDGRGTFNVSTTVAFVAAAAGCPIAKHGNRSVSSNCGSADLLEHLGVDPSPDPQAAADQLREHGLCFLYAPRFHAAARHAATARREIGVRSIFNLVGPMTNPAGCRRQLMGVFDAQWCAPVARVLQELGSDHCLVVHSEDGLDEISIAAPTHVAELRDGRVTSRTLDPRELGFELQPLDPILGGEMEKNAALTLSVLEGSAGPARDIVLLNAAATLYVGGISESIEAGVAAAADAVDSGRARQMLRTFQQESRDRDVRAA